MATSAVEHGHHFRNTELTLVLARWAANTIASDSALGGLTPMIDHRARLAGVLGAPVAALESQPCVTQG